MTDPGTFMQSDGVQHSRRGPYSVCRSRGSVCGVFQGEFGNVAAEL